MKINWFQIKNFKSIIDTGKCFVEDDITILAGKNESGKTSILEALACLENKEIPEDNNCMYSSEIATVTVSYHINTDDIYNLFREFEFDDIDKIKDMDITLSLIGNELEIDGVDILVDFLGKHKEFFESDNGKLYLELNAIIKKYAEKLEQEDLELELFLDNYENILKNSKTFYAIIDNEKDEQRIKDIIELISGNDQICKKYQEFIDNIADEFWSITPNIVLFSSFEDILPDSISKINKDKKIVKSLCKIIDMDVEKILALQEAQKRTYACNKLTANITGDFSSFYNQNKLNLKFSTDGEKINFFIYDLGSETPFRPEQRSKGFQWFLSFYIALTAQSKNFANNIILIDEPGLFLHPKAQEDVLEVLKNMSKNNQIIFTTHSPYLIDVNHLQRIRLVEKETREIVNSGLVQHTIIRNKLQTYSNRDTITPIVTAIGYNMSMGINININGMIVVEGISDNYYINKFYDLLGIENDYNIIYASGASQIPNIVSILIGWGVKNIICILDNDKEGKNVQKILEKNLNFNNIVLIPGKENSIEDLITKNDFDKYVLKVNEEGKDERKESNSKIAKEKDKVLISKLFSTSIDISKDILEKETVKNIEELIKLIEEKK